ncbi:MAG: PA2169 family four-helix-bundle protein [Acidobacteriaceae bacterium]|nr:PA2169 family four-helix-bundle protein [Acidobacteriaceae bacterium]MBV9223416.1 PA2169 family four-helix-bundle protein [Acidobacteriaceae bacterium]
MATETNDTKDVVSVLNDLIETCKDGEQGFRTAAEKAKDSSLKSLFSKYASQRAGYVTELQSAVRDMGGDPATSGHVAATLHRGWINLKEALSRDEDKAIINECESGEDAAIKNYKDALSKSLPANLLSLVQKQFSGVQEAHGVIRDLKHSLQGQTA